MQEQRAAARFKQIVGKHEMTVLRDDGLYRHIRFKRPDELTYWFDLVTWPGYLALNGDLVSGYTFSRIEDMFRFFEYRSDVHGRFKINPHYWSEKITNHDAMRGTRVYSEAALQNYVREALRNMAESEEVGLPVLEKQWQEHVQYVDLSTEGEARRAIDDFRYMGRGFVDAWEWDLTEWSYSYLLCCHAIGWGIRRYRGGR